MNDADKAILSPPKRVASISDIPEAWLANVRAMLQKEGRKVRAGFPACIEVSSPHGYMPLNLPTNGVEFTGKRDRDLVLRRLAE